MEPINYLAQVADPFAASLKGYAATDVILNAEAKRAEALRLQQLQQQQQQQLAQEQAKFFANPNPTMRDAARFASVLTPEQSKAFLPFMEGISKEQQQNTLKTTGQLLAALQTNPQVFITKARENALAARNSGDMEDATLYEQMAEAAADPKRGPGVVFKSLAARTAGIPGAKEFFETIDKSLSTARAEAEAPSKLSEQVAKASKAVVDAQIAIDTAPNEIARLKAVSALEVVKADFARANAELDVKQKGATLRKTESDIIIDKENARIAALNAASAKETNVLKRAELQQKIDEATEKRNAAEREQQATIANQSADIDNFLNTAARVLNTPKDIIEKATGPIASELFTTNVDVADFESLVEALGSQAFIAQIPKIKGTGSLSEKEGDKLQASLQTLSLRQSPARLRENVTEAVRLLTKVRENIAVKYGKPAPPLDVPARKEVFVALPDGSRAKFPNQAAADAYKKAAGIK